MVLEQLRVKEVHFTSRDAVPGRFQAQECAAGLIARGGEDQIAPDDGGGDVRGVVGDAVVTPQEAPVLGAHADQPPSGELDVLADAPALPDHDRRVAGSVATRRAKLRHRASPHLAAGLLVQRHKHRLPRTGSHDQALAVHQRRLAELPPRHHLPAGYFPLVREDLFPHPLKTVQELPASSVELLSFGRDRERHPYRYLAHNGEINTIRGNINWMKAREALCKSELLPELERILPIIEEEGSDSAIFDNVLDFLYMGGRELAHAILMMIPEPWANHESMDEKRKAFYEFHAGLMEPWDGPASIAFTDGSVIGAVLDRNGLRPSRYYVTSDGLVVMASEVGVLDIPPENVLQKERLHPGRIFLVDTKEGRIVADAEIKSRYARMHPYREWLKKNTVFLADLPAPRREGVPNQRSLRELQMASAIHRRICGSSSCPWRKKAWIRWARWAPTPLYRFYPTALDCCTTTSSSSSHR